MYVKSFVQCILTYLTLKPSLSIQGLWPNILAHLRADKQEDIRRVPEPAALVSPPNSDKPTSTRPLHFHHYTVWWRSDPKNKREEEVSIKKTFDQLEVLCLQLSTFFHNRWIWHFFSGHWLFGVEIGREWWKMSVTIFWMKTAWIFWIIDVYYIVF